MVHLLDLRLPRVEPHAAPRRPRRRRRDAAAANAPTPLEPLLRVVMRLGFIVAGADGVGPALLDPSAGLGVVAEQSGLSMQAVCEERRKAKGGADALSTTDLALLRKLAPETLDALVEDLGDARGPVQWSAQVCASLRRAYTA
jgi:hypothetical protein